VRRDPREPRGIIPSEANVVLWKGEWGEKGRSSLPRCGRGPGPEGMGEGECALGESISGEAKRGRGFPRVGLGDWWPHSADMGGEGKPQERCLWRELTTQVKG
jgi:hypothetical protein